MAIGPDLLKILGKKYEPASFVERRYKGYDLGFKTDAEGNAILLFIGKKSDDGNIRGQRYARRLVKNKDGTVLKDHWDDKGKTA
jgi:hypothetical protein